MLSFAAWVLAHVSCTATSPWSKLNTQTIHSTLGFLWPFSQLRWKLSLCSREPAAKSIESSAYTCILSSRRATIDGVNLTANAARRLHKEVRRKAKGNPEKHHPSSETTYHNKKARVEGVDESTTHSPMKCLASSALGDDCMFHMVSREG